VGIEGLYVIGGNGFLVCEEVSEARAHELYFPKLHRLEAAGGQQRRAKAKKFSDSMPYIMISKLCVRCRK
jgi:hypothetical protein